MELITWWVVNGLKLGGINMVMAKLYVDHCYMITSSIDLGYLETARW